MSYEKNKDSRTTRVATKAPPCIGSRCSLRRPKGILPLNKFEFSPNTRGEVQSAAMYRGDNPPASGAPASSDQLPGRRFEYRYDNIGNRITAGQTGSMEGGDDEYQTNALNQYISRENNTVRILGTVASGAAVVSDVGAVNKVDRSFGGDLVPDNDERPARGQVSLYALLSGSISKQSKPWMARPQFEEMTYDADGNLVSDGQWDYTYDAENRLIAMTSIKLPPDFERKALTFQYDYLNRRVQKTVTPINANGSTGTTVTRRYIYDGWNLIAEIGNESGRPLKRTFTWGLDLTGSFTATAGVGALVGITTYGSGGTLGGVYHPTYDGNGNVVAIVKANSGTGQGGVSAVYEYSPAGELLRCQEDAALADQPFRFSTKFMDVETGLVYYGARYYSPGLGRFINRDPIAEQGGLNLYGFCGNDGVNHWDYLGYSWLSKKLKKIGKWVKKNWTSIVGVALNLIPGIGTALSVAWSAGVGYAYGGVKGLLIGAAAGAIGGGLGKAIGGAVVGQLGLKGFAAAVTRGAITGSMVGGVSAGLSGRSIGDGMLAGAITGGALAGATYAVRDGGLSRAWQSIKSGAESAIGWANGSADVAITGSAERTGVVILGEATYELDPAGKLQLPGPEQPGRHWLNEAYDNMSSAETSAVAAATYDTRQSYAQRPDPLKAIVNAGRETFGNAVFQQPLTTLAKAGAASTVLIGTSYAGGAVAPAAYRSAMMAAGSDAAQWIGTNYISYLAGRYGAPGLPDASIGGTVGFFGSMFDNSQQQ